MSLAVITGAASGIGAALADVLAARGTRLVLADVDLGGLAETAVRTGGTAVPTDVADPAAMDALAEHSVGARLVCLNAGIVGTAVGAPWEVPPEDWDRVFAVNVGGVVNGLRAFVPRLLATDEPAHVLVTASLAGMAVFGGGGAYGPSKHAVSAVVQHAAMALAGTPVTIGMICPALVATGLSAEGVAASTVAEEALDAVDAGVFAVVPPQWRAAVIAQVGSVVAGRVPVSPVPDSR
ncbi:SDR family oxidoreductase [Pseudonocardia abyssalis]|uniref:SDR family NAD(P)-dependent oxidoreductase n=1 Tax=Pseudonocardia abyssalis TaxID=2792008 RepID=A0ABS6UL01_9PSEU|nr:SDR family NAD(P)-dependent oxidoreductase [Pseudonocardia abyssalis]MBW0117245.1 SDR family NAD(P)-dependent oxidoreductase [Pseudonocardia abyssalis]MBW0132900.1 SDR family NAD(P)-dependent oxidoreductase [Pseudonocardia abyssalis]